MGKAVEDKNGQMIYIRNRMDMLLNVLDAIDPETAGIEEIDRIIGMIEDLELKLQQFRKDWE